MYQPKGDQSTTRIAYGLVFRQDVSDTEYNSSRFCLGSLRVAFKTVPVLIFRLVGRFGTRNQNGIHSCDSVSSHSDY